MGTWYLSLAFSLFLIFIGLYIHWSVVLVGVMLPFIPMISVLLERRSRRRDVADFASEGKPSVPSADRCDDQEEDG